MVGGVPVAEVAVGVVIGDWAFEGVCCVSEQLLCGLDVDRHLFQFVFEQDLAGFLDLVWVVV